MIVKSNGVVIGGNAECFKSLKQNNVELFDKFKDVETEFKSRVSQQSNKLYSFALVGAFWTPFGEVCKDVANWLFTTLGLSSSSFGTIGETMDFIGLGGAFEGFAAGVIEGLIVFVIVLMLAKALEHLGIDLHIFNKSSDKAKETK